MQKIRKNIIEYQFIRQVIIYFFNVDKIFSIENVTVKKFL